MNFNISNLVSGIIVTLLGSIFLFLSFGINTNPNDTFDAAFMPIVYTSLIILFGITIIVNSFRDKVNQNSAKDYRGPILTMFITILYIILIPIIGYYPSTIIMIFIFFLVVRFNNKLLFILTPFIASGFIYIVFEILLNVPVPAGALFS